MPNFSWNIKCNAPKLFSLSSCDSCLNNQLGCSNIAYIELSLTMATVWQLEHNELSVQWDSQI